MIQFVTTPTQGWLEDRIGSCANRFLVSSPYVTDFLLNLVKRLPAGIKPTLLTRTDLRDFAVGASDIAAVCDIAKHGAAVLSLARLHAKVYVVDSQALVTSANATHGGMRRNWECGVAIKDYDQVQRLTELFLTGFGAKQRPQSWKTSELESLKEPVRLFREAIPPIKHLPDLDTATISSVNLPIAASISLAQSLPAWTRLLLEGINSLAKETFTIAEVYTSCFPIVEATFPNNRHPREKIRQQLQRLRDLGVIDFLGDGHYRRIVNFQS